jgi:histidine ammonia-lyase
MTRSAVLLMWKLLAIEALALAQAADLRPTSGVMGGDYRRLYEWVRGVSPKIAEDRPLAEDIGKVVSLLQSEQAQQDCLRPDHTHEED